MSKPKPLLLFDGKCGFCRIWIDYWRLLTGSRIEYAPSQERGSEFPQIDPPDFEKSVQLVQPNGDVTSGARAVFESLGWERAYKILGGPSEVLYRFIAARRNLFYHLTKFSFGTKIEPTLFTATSWLFIRALAVVYLIAFGSLAVQVTGLWGEHGILPVRAFLANVARSDSGLRYLAVPSIFWLGNDDPTLQGMCFAGMALALLLILTGFRTGKFERLILFLLYVLYLSFVAIGQEFMGFQWDSLLLEAGFLAIFLTRNRAGDARSVQAKIIPWLFRWLGFRLFFLSGAVKLLSEDTNWRNLSALAFHWHTQPLPTVLAWYADKLPSGFQHFATWMTLAIELVVPFSIVLPRRMRHAGAWILIGFQVLIVLSGNYTFFNLLSIALLLFWFEDQSLGRLVPSFVREKWQQAEPQTSFQQQLAFFGTFAGAFVVIVLSLSHLLLTFTGRVPATLNEALRYSAPLEMVNTYGLFADMTTRRMEIVVEGSQDGEQWQAYEFRYKPGDVNRMPGWIAPHQPRLDWQMWFAALGNYQQNIWFVNFAVKLLEGSTAVEDLLSYNPFAGHPPKYVRALAYEYTFTDGATHRRTGTWWQRELRGLYLPAVALRSNPSPQ